MKKVLLVNPFLTVYLDDPAGISPPLGLAYLASYLERQGVKVKILDAAAEGIEKVREIGGKKRYGLPEEEIIKRIKDFSPEIVGITCQSTLHAKDAQETAAIVKKANPKILVVMGGAHPSALPEEVLSDKNIDLVVRGEGEVTLGEIVNNYSNGSTPLTISNLINILGISYREGKKIVNNPPRPLIKNLDSLPFPARHLLPMAIYLREINKGTNYCQKKRVFTMMTSRGCPGNCIYCAVRTVWGRKWRGRSPSNVVDEIETLIKDYHAEEIHFLDDSLSVDKPRLLGICEEIIKRKIKIKWTTPNGIAVWLLDKGLLLKMKKAGCYRLTFGLESGNKKILKNFIGKDYDYQKAKEIISFASSIGLWTVGTFIFGFPYEKKEQINETINFAKDTDLDFAVFYIANPFPGTPMFEIYQKENLLPLSGAYEMVRGGKSLFFSHEELQKLQAKAFSLFWQNRLKKPQLFLRKIRSFDDLSYATRLGKNFLKMVSGSLIKVKGIAALWK
ncbi:MAG: B12-binding domain-containing radical SAM protein [Patescibacteria group bacterium]|nr:B12-binding domain-containing radical SAM protein [Patescibacteria group bacterium]